MFQSSNFFKGIPCPFYQHDLCHRPYCHFKHAKVPKEKEKKKGDIDADEIITSSVEESLSSKNVRKRKARRTPSPIEDIEEDVLNVVKNITPSKLIEYEKRRQEVQELQHTLEQVDMEPNTHVDSIIASKNYTLCSKDSLVATTDVRVVDVDNTDGIIDPQRGIIDAQRGLIDSFYSKDKVKVNITSGNLNTSPPRETVTTLNDLGEVSRSAICDCDDPDCSGFIEDNDSKQFKHTIVDLSKITDEYMRRKMQRRLKRKQHLLCESETYSFVIPRGDKGIPLTENIQNNFEEEDENHDYNLSSTAVSDYGCNMDISNTDPSLFVNATINNDSAMLVDTLLSNNDSMIVNTSHPDPDPDPGTFTVHGVSKEQPEDIDEDLSNYIEKCKQEYARKKKERLEKEKKALLEEQQLNETDTPHTKAIGKENVETVVNNKEGKIAVEQREKRRCSNEKKIEKVTKDSSSTSLETTKSSSVKCSAVEKKKTFTDVDFFSTTVKRNMTSNKYTTDNNDDCQSDNETKEKHKEKKKLKKLEKVSSEPAAVDCSEPMTNSSKKRKKKKKKTNSSEEELCQDDDSSMHHTNMKKSKKAKTNNSDIEETTTHKQSTSTSTEHVAKKKKVSDNNNKHERPIPNEDNNCSKTEKRNIYEKKICSAETTVSNLQNDTSSSKKKKTNTEKHEHCEEKKKIKKTPTDFTSGNKNRTDSESSTASGFDVIAISSSEDDGGNADDGDNMMSSADECGDDDASEYVTKYDRCVSKDDTAMETPRVPGEGKKRVALSNEQINRKTVAGQKPSGTTMLNKSVNKAKSRLEGTHTSSATTNGVTMEPSSSYIPLNSATAGKENSTTDSFYGSSKKQRIAHVPQLAAAATGVKKEDKSDRPKLQVEVGGKIPHLLRQRYFDKMIDELLPKVATKQEAFDKAIAEETDAHKRSNRKPIYMNLCANVIKRVRAMPDYVAPKQPPKPKGGDPMETAQPTTKSVKTNCSESNNNSRAVKSDVVKTNAPAARSSKSTTIAGYHKVEKKETIPKNCIKPASVQLVNSVNTTLNTDKQCTKRERKISTTLEALELTEDNFYEHMQQYLLTDEQLWENKYPRRDPDNQKHTKIKDYVPSTNSLKRVCCRCGKEYFMNKKGKYVTRNECHYHWGKLFRQRGRDSSGMIYTCCGTTSDAGGSTCAMCRLHVSNKVGPLENYASTELCDNKDSKRKVFALDCEMCYTTQGLELTRLTVIDFDMEQIIDIFVKPTNPIVDYNTRFSGVTKEHLQDVTTTISDIHDILLNMFDKDTILMGHSLESDLNALSLIHHKVVDTSIVFPHRMGLPLKRALRNLMVEYMHKVIQSGDGGHDSCEDARSCMDLMKYKFKEDQKLRKRLKPNPQLPYSLPPNQS